MFYGIAGLLNIKDSKSQQKAMSLVNQIVGEGAGDIIT